MMKRNNPTRLTDFYSDRKGQYIKSTSDELFLKKLNKLLYREELSYYQDLEINYPFIFVFGPPRSGTTLMTQVIAHCFDIGYINNFAARFFLAPLHGLRLSDMILGNRKHTNFQSNFAHTDDPTDIHEFGYFWRHWLKKEDINGIIKSEQVEEEIDWPMLTKILANVQNHFNKGLVFKNIFGSYHLQRLTRELKEVIFVYITRDMADAAVSILGARRKYYKDPNTWWSYMPKEYNQIKDLNYMNQIAGQVYYLKKYYDAETDRLSNVVKVTYAELANNPKNVLNRINLLSRQHYNYDFPIMNDPPAQFPLSKYPDSPEKKQFQTLIDELTRNDTKSVNK